MCEGFIGCSGENFHRRDKSALPLGARLMTYECGDEVSYGLYSGGDIYLKFTDQGQIWTGQGHSLNLSLIWNISGSKWRIL